jgi:hypothetical protein
VTRNVESADDQKPARSAFVSFLNQLKTQANALQTQQGEQQRNLQENCTQTENVCRTALYYLQDVARHLNVIEPAAGKFTLDGKIPWPAMKLVDFRVDARRKMLRNREVYDYLAIGWRIVPRIGSTVGGQVSVNFPPDLQRVEHRLGLGMVKHERHDVRHPETNALQAIRFEYTAETRGNVVITPNHDEAVLAFRLLNVTGFGVQTSNWPAAGLRTENLDDLAKLLVGEPSRFL